MSENASEDNEAGTAPDEAAPSRALTASGGNGEKAAAVGRLPLALAAAALVMVLILAGGGAYGGWLVWERLDALREQAETAASQADEAASRARNGVAASALDERAGELAARIEGLDQRVGKLGDRIGDRDDGVSKLRERVDKLAQAQSSLDRSMAEVQEIARTNKEEWQRSEAAYLTTVAVHRLRYYRDVDAALGALKEAHELLADFGGEHIEARKGVARAIDRLIEVDPPRLGRIQGRLAELRQAVAKLPTASGPEGPTAGRSGGQSQTSAADAGPAQLEGDSWRARAWHAWDQFTGALGGLVTVSNERSAAPLRTPEQRFFLEQNLKLQIEAARLAALRGDQATYEASLDRLLDWLDTYFDGGDDRVASVRERIANVSDARVSVELPEIAPLVERVRSFE